jgi:UDP-N-acetylmuramyl pentapeptide phosphotransferase/UDP-N-acetylglucosamine-1-phosphate transferase
LGEGGRVAKLLFVAFFISVSLSGIADQIAGYPYMSAALVILFFAGLKDDLVGLSPIKKLVAQVGSIALVIFGSGIYINDFYGMFGVDTLPLWVAFTITSFTMVVVINAYNLIDGIDGLASSVGLLAAIIFGSIFWISGNTELAIFSFMLAVSLFGFLLHNKEPASIFMGDTGSMLVGFVLAILAVEFISLNEISAYTELFSNSSAILPVAILSVPLYDTLRVFYRRSKRKISPFDPGKDHIHHEFLKMGLSHTKTVGIVISGMLFTIGVALLLKELNGHIMLAGVLCSTLIFYPTNGTKRRILHKIGLCPDFIDKESYLDILKNSENVKSTDSKKDEKVPSSVNL